MKWFKHLAGSLNNSFVFELIEKFGGDGYLVFFGTLELMADEYNINRPGLSNFSIKKLTKNLQLSRQKTLKVLQYCNQKAIESLSKTDEKLAENYQKTGSFSPLFGENLKKNYAFFVQSNGTHVAIYCPRLQDLTDRYTKKLISKKSVQDTDNVTPIEAEEEEEDIYRVVEKEEIDNKYVFLYRNKRYVLSGLKADGFKKFWDIWEDKTGKSGAAYSWMKIPKMTESLIEEICKGARRYNDERKKIRARKGTPKMAQGWLAEQRWKDILPEPHPLHGKVSDVTIENINLMKNLNLKEERNP